MSQNEIFLNGEADQWYQRNKNCVSDADTAWLCQQLQHFKDEINQVFEIGCSSGEKLKTICEFFSCSGQGVDPSPQAVTKGNMTTEVTLHVGTASKLPAPSESFDLVYFGFCLYLVDRKELLASLAEADRILRPGGFLAITDFDPMHAHKRPYHHKNDVFSYKQDYAKFFTNSELYYLIAKHSFSHQKNYFQKDENERISITLLYKEQTPYKLDSL